MFWNERNSMKRNKKINGKLWKRCAGLLLCVLLVLPLLPAQTAAAETKPERVRVGWFEDSYNITGKDGERSSYGYEYQQSVAVCTGWIYDYVNAGWSELLRMMERGELDLMSGVSYTEERAQSMLFSELPMARSGIICMRIW